MKKYLLSLSTLVLLSPIFAFGHAEEESFGHMSMMGIAGGMHWSGWVTVVLFWILMLTAIIALLTWADKNKKK